MDERIYDVFDAVRAEEELKQRTRQAIRARIETNKQRKFYFSFRRFGAVVAVLAVIFALGFSSVYFMPNTYIDVDVNSSFAITLNRFGRVLKVTAYNEEGAGILKGRKLENKPYDEVIQILLESLLANGELGKDELVSVTVQTDNSENEMALVDHLHSSVLTALQSHHVEGKMEIYAVSSEVLDVAHSYNVSPARYIAIEELQEVDETTTFEKCASHSLGELRQQKENHETSHHGAIEETSSDDKNVQIIEDQKENGHHKEGEQRRKQKKNHH